MAQNAFIPLSFQSIPEEEQLHRAREFYDQSARRRSVREFSTRPVSRQLIDLLLATAGTAPSGANKQPWKFVIVDDPDLKSRIRGAAEKEEKENYARRMPDSWLQDLEPLGTTWQKEFLETAPVLVVVFKERFRLEGEELKKNYYVEESVGIACGLLVAAIHNAGLACLTHTPSPMDFLRDILERPPNEVPYLLMPIGYPKEGTRVPDLQRKSLSDIRAYNLSA